MSDCKTCWYKGSCSLYKDFVEPYSTQKAIPLPQNEFLDSTSRQISLEEVAQASSD